MSNPEAEPVTAKAAFHLKKRFQEKDRHNLSVFNFMFSYSSWSVFKEMLICMLYLGPLSCWAILERWDWRHGR